MERCAADGRGVPRRLPVARTPARAPGEICRAGSGFCADRGLHPYLGVRRAHVEVYLRQLEQQVPALANSTLRRRISTLSSWCTWLEDEEINVADPAARVRRPRRHSRAQPWLDRNELTDLLAAAEAEGGYNYALVCLSH